MKQLKSEALALIQYHFSKKVVDVLSVELKKDDDDCSFINEHYIAEFKIKDEDRTRKCLILKSELDKRLKPYKPIIQFL